MKDNAITKEFILEYCMVELRGNFEYERFSDYMECDLNSTIKIKNDLLNIKFDNGKEFEIKIKVKEVK